MVAKPNKRRHVLDGTPRPRYHVSVPYSFPRPVSRWNPGAENKTSRVLRSEDASIRTSAAPRAAADYDMSLRARLGGNVINSSFVLEEHAIVIFSYHGRILD